MHKMSFEVLKTLIGTFAAVYVFAVLVVLLGVAGGFISPNDHSIVVEHVRSVLSLMI